MGRETNERTTGNGMDSGFTCPDCGGHEVSTILHHDAFDYGSGDAKATLHTQVPVRCCEACNFEYLDHEGQLIRHEAVCRHLGVLTPTDIRRIRERHGLSRAAFAKLTGLGEATLNRWENGAAIQDRAYDHYLRLLESPETLQKLSRPDLCGRTPRPATESDEGKQS